MDRISTLSDELLLKILVFLPSTKDAVATMVLSKRWYPLWTKVPKLVFDDNGYQDIDYGKFVRFVDRSLLLHNAPTLKTLHFKVGQTCGVRDIPVWTRVANKSFVNKLIIEINNPSSASPAILPRSMYTLCGMLVKLKLNNMILVDVSSPVSFPSLKRLVLVSVKYPGDEFVERLLSSCHVLEELEVNQCPDDNVTIFTVRVPSLEYLYLRKSPDRDADDAEGFVIDAPSLEYLYIQDICGGSCIIENDMPNIVMAEIEVGYQCIRSIMGSITSVKDLYLCCYNQNVCPFGSVFHYLERLRLGTCETEWLTILKILLKDSPNLQSLKLDQCHVYRHEQPRPCWSEPSSVPECLLSSLDTVEWLKYRGTDEEKEVVAFILRNGSCLKKLTISSKSTDPNEKLEMIKELSFLPRRSPTCHLTFY